MGDCEKIKCKCENKCAKCDGLTLEDIHRLGAEPRPTPGDVD